MKRPSPLRQTLRQLVAQESAEPFVTLDDSSLQPKTTAVSVAFYFLTLRLSHEAARKQAGGAVSETKAA